MQIYASSHRNLRIGYFSQHHVDSLSMNQSSLDLFRQRFPGIISFFPSGNLPLRGTLSFYEGRE